MISDILEKSYVNIKTGLRNDNWQDFLNLEITVDGHSAIVWKDLELFGFYNNSTDLQIYQDVNNNNKVDLNDKKLSIEYEKRAGSIYIKNINKILFSGRNWDNDYLGTIDVLPAVYNYLLYLPKRQLINQENFQIKLNFINSITDSKTEPMIKYYYFD